MKKTIVLFFGLLVFGSVNATMPEDSAQVIMQEANKLYESSEYMLAIDLYKKIEADYRSPVLFYNIGNCYFKTGNLPEAIVYYERSLKYDPENQNTLANLQQVNKLITDDIQAMPQTAVSQWWYNFTRNKSINFWANLSIYFMIAGFLILLLTILRTPNFIRKFSMLIGSLLIIAGIFTFFLANTAKNNIENDNYAIIFTPKVDVMSEPKDDGSRLFVIHDGLKVDIISENNEWYEIQLANGAIGWIKKDDCKVI
jgi:tetratricopeptide (TPR) repeat protein